MRPKQWQTFILRELERAEKEATRHWVGQACLVSGCSERAIQSHSQQKERELRAIAEEGCVMALERSGVTTLSSGRMLVKRGIGKVSRFPGFCAEHDRTLFRAVDKGDLHEPSLEIAGRLALRAIAYEYRIKQRQLFRFQNLVQRLSSQGLTDTAHRLEPHVRGLEKFLSAEGADCLRRLIGFALGESESLHCCWFRFRENLGVSVTCVMTPMFEAYELNRLTDSLAMQPLLMFSLIPERDATHACFCWLERDDCWCAKFVRSPISASVINRLAFAESEDTTLRPSLWENASAMEKQRTLDVLAETQSRSQISDEALPRLITTSEEQATQILRI